MWMIYVVLSVPLFVGFCVLMAMSMRKYMDFLSLAWTLFQMEREDGNVSFLSVSGIFIGCLTITAPVLQIAYVTLALVKIFQIHL